jgi:hypothetical protein
VKTEASLHYLAAGKKALSPKKLKQIQNWIDDDWESHDINRDAVRLIQRLLITLVATKEVLSTLTEAIEEVANDHCPSCTEGHLRSPEARDALQRIIDEKEET